MSIPYYPDAGFLSSRLADARIPRPLLWRTLIAIVAAVLIGLSTPSWAEPVAWALFALLVTGWLTFELIPSRRGETPLDDIGFWYTIAVVCYGGLPLLVWLVLGGTWTPLNDLRLFQLQPSTSVVATLGFYYALHLSVFSAVYLAVRGRSLTPRPVQVEETDALTALILLGVTSGLLWVVSMAYPTRGASYADSYLAIQRLPLELRQLVRLAAMMRVVVSLFVLAWLFAVPRRRRWAYAWILFSAALTLTSVGDRTGLASLIVGALILGHRQIRPIRPSRFILLLFTGLLAFTALGTYRTLRGLEDREAFSVGVSAGEFESVFGNTVDLWTRRWDGTLPKVPSVLLPSEILAPIPSQILPFQKQDYANWYLSALYPRVLEQGGGLAFGVLAQAAIGGGILELILRGALAGLIFGGLRLWYGKRYASAAVTVAYLWCVIFAYHAVRTGTLSNLTAFVQFVPMTLLLVVFARHWRTAMAGERA